MTTAELELAPIEAAPAEPLTLAALAVRPLSALEPALLALSARYDRVAFDLKTPKGLAGAKEARHDLRENGRYAIQRARDGFKKDAEAAKRAVEAEAERLIALVKPREDELDTNIRNREAEIEAEKAEKARIERERVEALQGGVARLLSYSDRAIGQPAEKIAQAITALEAMAFTEERWQEFTGRAGAARDETVGKLRVLLGQALEAERLRAENERMRAEAAQRQQEEDARVAALTAQQKETTPPADAGGTPGAVAAPADAAPKAAREAENPAHQREAAQPATVTTPGGMVVEVATGEVIGAAPPSQQYAHQPQRDLLPVHNPAAPAGVHVDTSADTQAVKLGDLCDRLSGDVTGGLKMTEAFIRSLGVKPLDSKGRAVLIAESALPDLRDELIARIREVLG